MTTPHAGDAPAPFAWTLPSRLEQIDSVCDQVRGTLKQCELDGYLFTVELLLREFLINAIIHGNGMDSEKLVDVELRIDPAWITLRITDEGPGFPWRETSCDTPDEFTASGRGLAIGSMYAHDVQFNDAGNEVTIHLSREPGIESEGR